jgi:hypothetical protein
VATAFVEKAALALGLEEKEALLLTVSAEEIFVHLCESASGKEVEIQCAGGGYYVQTEFTIPVENLNLRAFNFSTRIKPDEEAFLEDLGLVLASRSVDRFQVWEEKGQGLHLRLIKEKNYPAIEEAAPLPAKPLSRILIRTPSQEELKIFAQMGTGYYPSYVLPPFFRYPGKVVDMAKEGEFKTVIAVDPQGQIGGGILWYWRGIKIMACSGPYLFNQPKDSLLAETLLEEVLKDIARTSALGLLIRYPTAELPLKYFEPLGSFSFFPQEGPPWSITAYFRHLQEDEGSLVWSHPELEPFLHQEFQRMILPRERRVVTDFGEKRNPHSVLSTKFDRGRAMVTLEPMRPGADQEENLSNHLNLLRKEGWRNIFFEMDLAKSWQVEFTPALFKDHFTPRLLLPYAGQGDVVIFQAET